MTLIAEIKTQLEDAMRERDDLQSNEDASHLQSIKANPGPAARDPDG